MYGTDLSSSIACERVDKKKPLVRRYNTILVKHDFYNFTDDNNNQTNVTNRVFL